MRALLVSNRLPVTVQVEKGQVHVKPSSGGLATALRYVHDDGESEWIGWPGDLSRVAGGERAAVFAGLRERRVVPVEIGASEMARYYDGFANGVLWPICHYLLDKVRLDAHHDWAAYRRVNERFAEAVCARYRPGDLVWIHDYQLFLVPALLRRSLPDARIGFFLHVPFPAPEAFRILPWREEILRGILGADVIGFHTAGYAHHFTYAAAQLVGVEPTPDVIQFDGRPVAVGAYPISIDVAELDRVARLPEVQREADAVRAGAPGKAIVLGVDRLDYTKGIPRRLMAIERLLERDAHLRERLHFVQIAVPTRERVDAYAEYRRTVNELVGRINGRFGTPTSAPVHLMHRSIGLEDLVALYRAADVMLVTPLRDGMNLVAKEYVACRIRDDGVLVLSELAGAATELREAVLVNPYDIEGTASALRASLEMSPGEQRLRMRALRERLARNDVRRWSAAFLRDLCAVPASPVRPSDASEVSLATRIDSLRTEPRAVLLLDYDGTLVPFASMPDLAVPDAALLDLLATLAARPGWQVHLVSGRTRDSLERWFGALPVALHAEHGYWSRPLGSAAWIAAKLCSLEWKAEVRALFEDTTERTNGSHFEEKTSALAWHYRATEPLLARARLAELHARLSHSPSHDAFDLLAGNKVLEVRARGVHKGLVASAIQASADGAAILAAGDDRTDEDMFAALAETALTIRVGGGPTRACYGVPHPSEMRRVLRALVAV